MGWFEPGGTHLLLSTFIARSLHRLSFLFITQFTVLHIIDTSRGAIQPRHGDITLSGVSQAIGADSWMADTSHYGAGCSIIIMNPCP